jgi:hypothetical protein
MSLLQVAFSLWWLRRFQFGPLEWAWRSLAWWRWHAAAAGGGGQRTRRCRSTARHPEEHGSRQQDLALSRSPPGRNRRRHW